MNGTRFVVVTTDERRRGVFAGWLESVDGDRVILRDGQMCVYWSKATRSVVGLSTHGPQTGSRVSPAAPRLELNGVTAVMDTTEQARTAWQAEPWD